MTDSFSFLPIGLCTLQNLQTPQLSQLDEEDEASLHDELDDDDNNSQADSLDGSAVSSLGGATAGGGGGGRSNGSLDPAAAPTAPSANAAGTAGTPAANIPSITEAAHSPNAMTESTAKSSSSHSGNVSGNGSSIGSTIGSPQAAASEGNKSHLSGGLGRTVLWTSLIGVLTLALVVQLLVVLAPIALSECADLLAPLSDVSVTAAFGEAATVEGGAARTKGGLGSSSSVSGVAMTCSARILRHLLEADDRS